MLSRFMAAFVLTLVAGTNMAVARTDGTRTYIMLGTSQIFKNDTGSAARHATNDALVSAVGLGVNDLLSAGLVVDHFPTLNHLIFTRSDQFIVNYTVLAETRADASLLVLARVVVGFEKIRDALQRAGLLVDRLDMPGVLFMISRRTVGDGPSSSWWSGLETTVNPAEEEMTVPFVSRGYPVVRHFGFVPHIAGEEFAPDFDPGVDPDNATVARIGRQFNADIVIAGSVLVDKVLNRIGEEDMYAFNAVVQARAVKAESGEELASAVHSDIRLHDEEESGASLVIRAAAARTGDNLARSLSDAWLKRHREIPTHVRILARSPSGAAHLVAFRERITALRGVNHLKVIEMRANQTVFSVDFEYSARRLAKDIMLQTFDSFKIEISEITDDRMRITLTPR